MAATADDVRDITGLSLTDAQIAPFLSVGQSMADRVSACMIFKGIDSDTQDDVSAWLAAHYLSLSPVGKAAGLAVEEKFENYSVKTAKSQISGDLTGIMSTTYGQTANDLSGGCLSEVGKRAPKIEFY